MASRTPRRVRRARPLLVAFTPRTTLAMSGRSDGMVKVNGAVVGALNALEEWTTAEELARRLGGLDRSDVRRLLRFFAAAGLVEVEKEARTAETARPDAWESFGPAAAGFHFSTRLERYAESPQPVEAALRKKFLEAPPPPAVLRRAGAKTRLPPARTDSTLAATLLKRRTWRVFGRRAVTAQELSDLLGLTFGVQKWADTDGQGSVPLKTSPSGGACHPIEAYVLVRQVRGVKPGFYHYESDTHRLTAIRSGARRSTLRDCVQAQPWLGEASFLVFLCPVFARTAWRYPSSRAYRSILIEAGHLGQTFCLLAADLGMAPFCTLAVDDPHVDRQLRLDGRSQGVVYVVGAGTQAREGFKAGVPFTRSKQDA